MLGLAFLFHQLKHQVEGNGSVSKPQLCCNMYGNIYIKSSFKK